MQHTNHLSRTLHQFILNEKSKKLEARTRTHDLRARVCIDVNCYA